MGAADDGRERVQVASRAEWRAWLAAHHAESPGIWLVTFRKAAHPDRHLPYDDVVEEALCFGWVDSLPRRLDEARTMLRLTPRSPGSAWSRPNKDRVARLQAAGLMAPAGLAAVDRARADGSWTALDEVEDGVEPADLAAALDADPVARAHWDAFPRSVRRAILEWVATARRPATRANRVAETARLAAQGIRANQPRQPARARPERGDRGA